ncbi:MAG: hypothetical protein IJC46_00490, partial [Clostridia bacterium]|nr:hypothetical protein [Clostridia bacterium]
PRNLLALRSKILKSADFCSIKAQNAANTAVLASILTMSGQKSAFLKRGSGLIAHPKEGEINYGNSTGNMRHLRWQH